MPGILIIRQDKMTATPNLEHLALLKFGIAVPPQHRDEVLKLIKTSPNYKDEFELIKNSLNTMLSEDDFLQSITNSHSKIAEIPENSKVIMKRDTTYQIRAINPEHIASLTQRAFFNSFSLERIILNDQEEENTRKHVQEREDEPNIQPRSKPPKQEKVIQEEDKCICGRLLPGSEWILCNNENKCKGSGWYHLECAGVKVKEGEDLSQYIFVCESCRRPAEEEKQSQSSQKRFKYS